MSKPQGYIARCLSEAVADLAPATIGVDRRAVEEAFETGRLKVSRPPSRSIGDYSIALHYLFKLGGVDQKDWPHAAGRLIEALTSSKYKDECYVARAEFVNGYLNLTIDFNRLARVVLDDILRGGVEERLRSVGGGRVVVVEHTSANPVHPLHVGSGRNSVIGDTFARLLSKLGFRVSRRFYVNDMGRQVAFLVYGVSILKEAGVQPGGEFKTDHWYGIVYALTNLLIEERRLLREVREAEKAYWEALARFVEWAEREGAVPRSALDELRSLLAMRSFNKSGAMVARRLATVLSGLEKALANSAELKALKDSLERYTELSREHAKISFLVRRLAVRAPEVYLALSSRILDDRRALDDVRKLMKRCEEEDPATLSLFHEVSESVVKGFKETLDRLNIHFDAFDWESSKEVLEGAHEVVKVVESKPFARREDGALLVDLDQAAEHCGFVRELFSPDRPGKFIIERSDGTTLYVTRDVSYSVFKFRGTGADVVYNVIASEQSREQKQVKALLYLLGYEREARNLVHFVYELVKLKGMRMSGRRGVYYTLDELVEDYYAVVSKVYYETGKSRALEPAAREDVEKTLRELAVANARGLLLSVEPFKVLTFDPSRLEEALYGSTVLYSYVRLQSILRKLKGLEPLENMERLKAEASSLQWGGYKPSEVEEQILDALAEFERVVLSAYRELKPNRVLEYAMSLSNLVNKFYESHRVMGESDPEARAFREALVVATLAVMKELVDILGFPHVRRI